MESDIGIGPIPAFAGLTLAAGLYFTCLAVTHTIRAALFQRFGEAANLVVDPTTIRQAAGIYLLRSIGQRNEGEETKRFLPRTSEKIGMIGRSH